MTIRSAQRLTRPAFVYSWTSATLPMHEIRRGSRSQLALVGSLRLPRVDSGPADLPFDFCRCLHRLAADIARRCKELRYIDMDRVLVSVTEARNGRVHGLQARVTPLRFPGGALISRHRDGRTYRVQRFRLDGREMLYIMTFCLPRFLNLSFEEKLVTLFHEMYHIGPQFDGDLRRHNGRYQLHSHCQKSYDAKMAELARAYLAGRADRRRLQFLRLNFAQLRAKHGAVIGAHVPRPRLLQVRA